ncbi:hypothetical protein [Legionella maioricensis]|uniref:Uncharacterized protein n=1 Tax=Legionella maioricensis TaxID=2896528 RepID=A0A9X2D2M8_9GAMM|nr:hypothetical protein [Legionella maioricensis]MCL9684567.1 hypothetical protein [Legionella maioricensis]MCL9687348.1 hypothetical protein [Legionella maioricensis]
MKKFSKAHFSKAQRKVDKKISLEELNNISGGSEGLLPGVILPGRRRDVDEIIDSLRNK